tara:strand:- start:183 stop:311 length:129 start_codon:yes stop_codon:yes gene_type:complete
MQAIYAGLTAWLIEFTIVVSILYLVHLEEQKVYKKRQNRKEK